MERQRNVHLFPYVRLKTEWKPLVHIHSDRVRALIQLNQREIQRL